MSAIQPLVTIITPTYNREGFIGQSINSVLSQTYPNFELLIIDDGSTDRTQEVVAPYLADGRVRFFSQENQGQSVARDRGLYEAKGGFVCFLDSDNAWFPDKLEKSLQVFEENPSVDIVYGDYMVIDAEGRELGVNRMKRYSGRITPMLIHDNFVSMNTTMTRRRCFEEMGGFESNDRLAEDYGLWLRFSTQYTFHYLPAVLGFYRVMEDQISTDKESRFKANEQLILEFLKSYPGALSYSERRHGLSRFYVRKGRYELSSGRPGLASKELARALWLNPLWSGPWRFAAKLAVHLVRIGAK